MQEFCSKKTPNRGCTGQTVKLSRVDPVDINVLENISQEGVGMGYRKGSGTFEEYINVLKDLPSFSDISNWDDRKKRGNVDISISPPDWTIDMSKIKYKGDVMTLSVSPIDEALEPPTSDYVLHWVRHKVMKSDTVEDTDNIESHLHVGWLPVNPAYYPHLPCKNGRIECDGLVLYMRPRVDIRDLESNLKYFEEKIKLYREQLHDNGQQIDAYKLLLKTFL